MKTAVDWLEEMFNNSEIPNSSMLFKQAKEMEKKQIIEACKKGYGSTAIFRDKLAEQYYEQTFKSE
jgi:hypothetical protein